MPLNARRAGEVDRDRDRSLAARQRGHRRRRHRPHDHAAERDAKRAPERDPADTARDLRLKAFLIDPPDREPTGSVAGDLPRRAKQIDAAGAADPERSQTLLGTRRAEQAHRGRPIGERIRPSTLLADMRQTIERRLHGAPRTAPPPAPTPGADP